MDDFFEGHFRKEVAFFIGSCDMDKKSAHEK